MEQQPNNADGFLVWSRKTTQTKDAANKASSIETRTAIDGNWFGKALLTLTVVVVALLLTVDGLPGLKAIISKLTKFI